MNFKVYPRSNVNLGNYTTLYDYDNNIMIKIEPVFVKEDPDDYFNSAGVMYLENKCFDYRLEYSDYLVYEQTRLYVDSKLDNDSVVDANPNNDGQGNEFSINYTFGDFKAVFAGPNKIIVSYIAYLYGSNYVDGIYEYSRYNNNILKVFTIEFDGYVDGPDLGVKTLANWRITNRAEVFLNTEISVNRKVDYREYITISSPESLFRSYQLRLLENGNVIFSSQPDVYYGGFLPFDKIIILNQSLDVIKTFEISQYIPYRAGPTHLVGYYDMSFFMNSDSFSIMVYWIGYSQNLYQSLLFDNNGNFINIAT